MPTPSQSKKQSSISSFFAPKSSPTPSKLPTAHSKLSPGVGGDKDAPYEAANGHARTSGTKYHGGEKRLIDDGSDVENIAPPTKRSKRREDGVFNGIHDDENESLFVAQSPEKVEAEQLKQSDGIGKQPKTTKRTSKYLFSSSPVAEEDDQGEDDDVARQRRQALHDRFVKKLGRPESITEIKRRNKPISEDTADGEEVEEDSAEEEPVPKPPKGRKGAAAGKKKLTPMVQQIVDIKLAHMDTLLAVEVGYKFHFYGSDAQVASKELGVICVPGRLRFDDHPSEAHLDPNRFARAMIPVPRLQFHVKRLVQAGHKVGIVRQLETAALKKAGDNRNAPFVRQLTSVYTKATYVDDIEGLETNNVSGALATGFLLCLTETNAKGWGEDEKVHVGIVAVQPATGDIIYDDFEDAFMRSEVETRLLHIAPSEFLIVGELSKATDKLIKHLSGSKKNVFGDQARVERVPKAKTAAAESYSNVSNFYADKMKMATSSGDSSKHTTINVLDKVHNLSEHVTICLAAMIEHLKEYGLEHVFELTKNFQPFSARSHMLLKGNTLTSLEIYQNQTDHTAKGSLFWTMDRTRTRFGNRLLRKWVGRPLLDKAKLEDRIAAVEELKDGGRLAEVDKLRRMLTEIKADLEKSLIRIYYLKCSRPELLAVFQTLQRISGAYSHVNGPSEGGFSSPILNEAVAALPRIHDQVIGVLNKINPRAAKEDDKYGFFRQEYETEAIRDHSLGIAAVEADLDAHRTVAAEKLGKSKVNFVTVSMIEYLIEVENTQLKRVPASWTKISGTKKLSRFHTPEVVRMIRERDLHRESLAAACEVAFKDLLKSISAHYQEFRDCIQGLATLDCLVSLADLASSPGYVKPAFTSETRISVKQGRHPMVEQLLLDAYVPNDIELDASSPGATRSLLVTGPNMGGKSSYVRQVALICIMGQIGSYVPAESATLGMLDAVFTRMGAFDNMLAGESTFMVELSETADILKQATPRSLVLLDELGRGTSTHDGVAIAEAVLKHVVTETRCLCAFITHYQHLARLESECEGALKNVHMRFHEEEGKNGEEGEITFLYEVGEGVAHRSYGLNVARLANVPRKVLELAGVKSRELEESILRKRLVNLSRSMSQLLEGGSAIDSFVDGLERL